MIYFKQRGIANSWLYLIGLIALIGAVTAGIMALNAYETRIDKQGYDRGKADTEKKFNERDNKALQDAIKERDALMRTVRGLEKVHAEATSNLITTMRKEKTDEIRKRETIIAGLRDGSLVLRDPGREDTGCLGVTVPGTGTATSPTGPRTDAAGGAKLSGPLTEFLVSEASRADTLVRKATALQAQVIADRKACSTPIAPAW